ncbi:MAG: outer membrane protein OmpK [Fusobacteriaceae bacterium]
MKKLSLTLAALLSVSSFTMAKEIVAAPVVAVEPAVVVQEKIEAPVSKDFRFINLSLIHGNGLTGFGKVSKDTYGELEFGARNGALKIWGYIDFADALQNKRFSDANVASDKDGNSNFFTEIQPSLSLNDTFNADLSVGPIKEVYLSGYLKAGDGNGKKYNSDDINDPTNGDAENGLWVYGLGLGADVEVPWLGTMGFNAYALYLAEDFGSEREGKWDGYLVKNNWFKPFYFFENGTFLSYQGYMAYQFDAGYTDKSFRTSDEYQWFNGLFWHSNDYALGYGLKYTKNMMNVKDANGNDADGFSHFFVATYKF